MDALEVLVALALNGQPTEWHGSDGSGGALPAGDQRWPSVAPMLADVLARGWALVGVTQTSAPTGGRLERYVFKRAAAHARYA